MEQQENTYRYLKELSKSDFEIVEGEPNIIGWKVINESGTYIGEIKELLFDSQTQAVRYLIIDLTDNGMNLGNKQVMIPLGLAHLHTSDDEVVLPNIHISQFNALPNYETGAIGAETEVYIRSVIGSPAALRIEETISEFDQNQFYTHHHFDKNRFYQRGRSNENLASEEISGTASLNDRIEEKENIHDLIKQSKQQSFNASTNTINGVPYHDKDINQVDDDLSNPATRGI